MAGQMAEGREREDGFLLHYTPGMRKAELRGLSIGPHLVNLSTGSSQILNRGEENGNMFG